MTGPGAVAKLGNGKLAHYCSQIYQVSMLAVRGLQKCTYARAGDVSHGLARGEGSSELGRDGNGDDIGAIDEGVASLAESGELRHGGDEVVNHGTVVV